MRIHWRTVGRGVRTRHGTIAAYLALILASSAATYAAATVDSSDVVDNSIRSTDLKDGSAVGGADVFANSLTGREIDEGSLNAHLFKGAAAGVYTGSTNTHDYYAEADVYFPVSGISDASNHAAYYVEALSPGTALNARGLSINEYGSFPGDQSRTYILMVGGVDTALRCTLTDAQTTCTNTTASVPVPPGSALEMHMRHGTESVAVTEVHTAFGFRVVTP